MREETIRKKRDVLRRHRRTLVGITQALVGLVGISQLAIPSVATEPPPAANAPAESPPFEPAPPLETIPVPETAPPPETAKEPEAPPVETAPDPQPVPPEAAKEPAALPVEATNTPQPAPPTAPKESMPAPIPIPAVSRPEAPPAPRAIESVQPAGLFQDDVKPLTPEARKKVDELIEADRGDEVALQIQAKRSRVLRTKRPLARAIVSDPSVVDVIQSSPQEFVLTGKQEGTTNVILCFDQQQNGATLTYLVTVLPDTAAEQHRALQSKQLERKISALFPNSKIHLLAVGEKVVVRGQARDPREATAIYELVKDQYARSDPARRTKPNAARRNGDGVVLTGATETSTPATSIGAPPVANIGAPPVGATGSATGAALHAQAQQEDPSEFHETAKVVNMIEVPGESQVMLKVRIAEVRRAALRKLGASFSLKPSGHIGNFFFHSAPSGGTNSVAVFSDNDVSCLINALTANNTMKILAEPNLVTLSGQPASFLSGGSFPVPTAVGVGGVGAASTYFQGYGTQLLFLPTVLDKDRIRLQVTPSLSTLDRSTTVNGIPGLNLSTAFTTVDLREGQWLAVAGLLVDRQNGTSKRLPGLGEVPGAKVLFSNNSIKREEIELIVLVSPVLVHPLEPKQAPALLPGMDINEPDNFDFYMKGRWEGRPDIQYRSTVAPVVKQRIHDAKHGVQVQDCENFYIQGPRGFSR